MTIRVQVGDLFESDAQTLVNTVNCVGVMGRGIALGFRKRFPDMYKDYVRKCEVGAVKLGEPYVHRYLLPPWVLNFPTKDHWRSVASLADIIVGLEHLEANYRDWGIQSLAVPPLGCGEGRLDWETVGPELYRRLGHLQIPVDLYAPFGTPSAQLQEEFLRGGAPDDSASSVSARRIPIGWFGLVEVIARLQAGGHQHPIGRVLVQKVAYVAQEAGVPIGVTFEPGSYGPFAPALKQVITKLVNNGLLTEEREGRALALRAGPTYDDAARTFAHRGASWEPAIGRVVDLVGGCSARQAEVIATVLYVARQLDEPQPSGKQITADVLAWKVRRKPGLTPLEIADAAAALAEGGWLPRLQ